MRVCPSAPTTSVQSGSIIEVARLEFEPRHLIPAQEQSFVPTPLNVITQGGVCPGEGGVPSQAGASARSNRMRRNMRWPRLVMDVVTPFPPFGRDRRPASNHFQTGKALK